MTPSAVILSLCLISVCTLPEEEEDDEDSTTITTTLETHNISQSAQNINSNFVLKVNEMAKGNWTASSDFISLFPLQTLRNLASKNPVIDPKNKKLYMLDDKIVRVPPSSFKAFKNWPKCEDMILRVPKMLDTNFSTGWVTAMASVLTDRLCILSRGVDKVELSPVEPFQCCKRCCPEKQNCKEGGDALMAWEFWIENGIVSGEFSGLTRNVTGCKPYNKDALRLPCLEECTSGVPAPKFLHANVSDSTMRYKQEKTKFRFGKNIHVLSRNPQNIKSEIYERGPVQTAFKLYRDFFAYRNGVYVHVFGDFIGYHSVKIVGWGKENKLDYWLLVNVWGTKFGRNGTVKFLRGVNHCEIEENVIAAYYNSVNNQMQYSSNKRTGKSGSDPVLNSYHAIPFFIVAFIVQTDL